MHGTMNIKFIQHDVPFQKTWIFILK